MVTQGCCQQFLQSSTEPGSMFNVLGKSAVRHCWANAELYDSQSCKGVTMVTQGCCHLFLQSTGDPGSMFKGTCQDDKCLTQTTHQPVHKLQGACHKEPSYSEQYCNIENVVILLKCYEDADYERADCKKHCCSQLAECSALTSPAILQNRV